MIGYCNLRESTKDVSYADLLATSRKSLSLLLADLDGLLLLGANTDEEASK